MNIPDGIELIRQDGSIKIKGLKALSKEEAARVVAYVKHNKAEFLQEIGGALPRIEPMTRCLDGGQCKYLAAPGDCRPVCKAADGFIFDLKGCPEMRWARQHKQG